jgi:hypothetical protein
VYAVPVAWIAITSCHRRYGDNETDAIIRLLEQADDHLARTRDVLQKSPDLGAPSSPVGQVHQSMERTLNELAALRTAIHVAFGARAIHENTQALKSVEKVARELARNVRRTPNDDDGHGGRKTSEIAPTIAIHLDRSRGGHVPSVEPIGRARELSHRRQGGQVRAVATASRNGRR